MIKKNILTIFPFYSIGERLPGSCLLDDIVDRNRLDKHNLHLTDLTCSHSNESDRCLALKSYIKFTCKPGYIFSNLKSISIIVVFFH